MDDYQDKVERLALKLLREPDASADDMESARVAARRRLEDSEERKTDESTVDHEDDGVIRRTSSETATRGR